MMDKSVAEKAHIKPGSTIAVLNAVPGVVESLGLPDSVAFVEPGEAQLVFVFAPTLAELEVHVPSAAAQLRADSSIWIFFRKGSRAAGLDMNRNSIWAIAEPLGLRPLGLVSVDTAWSAFRFKHGRTD